MAMPRVGDIKYYFPRIFIVVTCPCLFIASNVFATTNVFSKFLVSLLESVSLCKAAHI